MALQPTLKTDDSSRLDLETRVRVEMAMYDEGGHMGHNLKKVYQALKSIPPTFVESERIFSSAGLMCNKIRSSLGDEYHQMRMVPRLATPWIKKQWLQFAWQ